MFGHLISQPLLPLALTLGVFAAATFANRCCKGHPFANPVLMSVSALILLLCITQTPYEQYFAGAQFIHFLLGPATVALALPLYRHLHRVRACALPILYQAWGSYLQDPLYQWTRETSARALGLNQHVSYVHSKFMLKDPLAPDSVVITGSANFSEASTNANDENMVLIRGDERAACIYFTEFNRLFNHYYFRSVQESMLRNEPQEANAAADARASLFLDPEDGWLGKYKPGSLRYKRMEIFTRMANAKTL